MAHKVVAYTAGLPRALLYSYGLYSYAHMAGLPRAQSHSYGLCSYGLYGRAAEGAVI